MTVMDIIYVSLFIFALALAGLLILTISSAVYPLLINSTIGDNPTANATMTEAQEFAESKIDYVVSGVIMILLLGILVFAYLSTANLIFTAIYVILLIMSGILAGVLQFAWEKITDGATLAGALAQMPITNFILSNLVLIMVGVGAIALILMYIGYNQDGGGYNG